MAYKIPLFNLNFDERELNVLGMLKDKHVVFDVKCTLDRKLVDGRL